MQTYTGERKAFRPEWKELNLRIVERVSVTEWVIGYENRKKKLYTILLWLKIVCTALLLRRLRYLQISASIRYWWAIITYFAVRPSSTRVDSGVNMMPTRLYGSQLSLFNPYFRDAMTRLCDVDANIISIEKKKYGFERQLHLESREQFYCRLPKKTIFHI